MVFGRLFDQIFESVIMVDVYRISISHGRMDYLVEKMRREKIDDGKLGKKDHSRNWMTMLCYGYGYQQDFFSLLWNWDTGHGTERGGK